MTFSSMGSSFILQHSGQPCTAVLQNVSSSFNGVLDTGTIVESDEGSQRIYPVGTRLKVLSSISSKMVETVTTVTTGGIQYQVNRILIEDDGLFSTLYLAPVTS